MTWASEASQQILQMMHDLYKPLSPYLHLSKKKNPSPFTGCINELQQQLFRSFQICGSVQQIKGREMLKENFAEIQWGARHLPGACKNIYAATESYGDGQMEEYKASIAGTASDSDYLLLL